MLNKVKRILQWFIGGCYILSGLAYIGEYTMPAIILIILGGVIILPPITKRIPAFKFKKIALILLSSIVMIAGIQLGETNLSPEVLAKRKAESEAAAASQAALEAQEAAESASRAAEEEAASKAAQEKAESEAAVATENEIASMKAMILKDCNLSDIPRDDKNQMANADEKNFYAAWKEAAAEKIAEKNQGNNAEDLVRITFEQMVDFYKKIYPDSTLINTEKGILESIDSASSEMEEAKTSDLGYSVEDAELYEGKFYIYKRMETHYDDTLLGSLQKELDSFNTSKAIEWLGLPGSLTAHQTKHDLKFTAGAERPVDGSQQEQPQRLEGVIVRVGSQKVPQAIADTLFPVPDKAVQVVPDGVVAVGVCRKVGGVRYLFLACQAVGLFQIQPDIFHVRIGHGLAAGSAFPADGL